MTQPHEDTSLDAQLRRLLRHACRDLRATWIEQLKPWDLTPFQSRALRALLACPSGMRLGELAATLQIAPRSATEVVDQLEVKGLVERVRDPHDRRALRIKVTHSGQSLGETILGEHARHSSQFFGALSDADKTSLQELLSKIGAGSR